MVSSIEPKGITVNASGSVYIVDAGNTRVEQWTVSPRITKDTYDGNGNLETVTDPDGNKTKYTYDADNERTKVEEPKGTVTETGYDAAGQSHKPNRRQQTRYRNMCVTRWSRSPKSSIRGTRKRPRNTTRAGNLTKR